MDAPITPVLARCVLQTLAQTHNMNKPKKTCVVETVNPKAVTGMRQPSATVNMFCSRVLYNLPYARRTENGGPSTPQLFLACKLTKVDRNH